MDSKVRYTLVGFFVLILLAALVVFFFWLSGERPTQKYETYLTYMSEEVTGLSVQSPIRYNGVPVGYVASIKLDPDNPQLVLIVLKIKKDAPITTSTVASLNSQGITGLVYLGLKTTTPRAPKLVALKGQSFPVIASRPSLLLQLSSVLPTITNNIQKISTSFSQVLNAENRQAIADSLNNIHIFTNTLAGSSGDLKSSIQSLKKTLNSTSVAAKDLPAMMQKLTTILNKVNDIADKVAVASNGVVGTTKDMKVTMQTFSQQVMPNASQMMLRLNTLSQKLNSLSDQLEHNPSMLLRGKVPASPGPGEKP